MIATPTRPSLGLTNNLRNTRAAIQHSYHTRQIALSRQHLALRQLSVHLYYRHHQQMILDRTKFNTSHLSLAIRGSVELYVQYFPRFYLGKTSG